MTLWREMAACALDLVRITVIETDGSAPREAGAAMIVTANETLGTIGGGALEHQAMATARRLLGAHALTVWSRETEKIPLGPSLGQCCGGAVRLLYERIGPEERQTLRSVMAAPERIGGVMVRPLAGAVPPRLITGRKDTDGLPPPVARAIAEMLSGLRPRRVTLIRDWLVEPGAEHRSKVYLYGAGHIGRAIVHVAVPLALDIVWVDTNVDRFPAAIPGDIRREIAADPAVVAGKAEAGCYHLVMTYAHAIDLAICHALLQRNDFAFLGLIGSRTKRGRFLSRLRQAGIPDAALQRLTCPIGVDGISGKEPAAIAVAAVAQLLQGMDKAGSRQRDDAGRAVLP
jgi:xanthine dehydrogenase accessory factor